MGARLVLVTVLVLAFYAVGVAVCELGLPLAGFTYASADEPLRYLAYTGLALLSTLCYALLSLLVAEPHAQQGGGDRAGVPRLDRHARKCALGRAGAGLSGRPPRSPTRSRGCPRTRFACSPAALTRFSAAGEVAGLPAPAHAALALAAATLAAGALALVAGVRRDVA